jgi:DNA-binding transcriptional MerR regulator
MKIGELGKRAGVTAKTIRYYESVGLLDEPERTPSGYRDYGDDAVERLRFIRDAKATGLSLEEIASIVDMRDHGEQTCSHVIALLDHHLGAIDEQIRKLRDTRRLLTEWTTRAKSLDPSACVNPNRCQTISPGIPPVPDRIIHPAPAAHEH